jgi:solute carrier family 25 phosphate transporter 23/24/25/41
MITLTSSTHSHMISFMEFRDFLLLLPRRACAEEIYRYYEVKRLLNPDLHGTARVNMEGMCLLSTYFLSNRCVGDVTFDTEDRPQVPARQVASPPVPDPALDYEEPPDDDDAELVSDHETHERHHWLGGNMAVKFLFAGGLAGAGDYSHIACRETLN